MARLSRFRFRPDPAGGYLVDLKGDIPVYIGHMNKTRRGWMIDSATPGTRRREVFTSRETAAGVMQHQEPEA